MSSYIATAIKMKTGCNNSYDLLEIDEICLNNRSDGWYKKAELHDHLKKHPGDITVGTTRGPEVVPCISSNGEKYVKSTPNHYRYDNLLELPRR